jgi:hypothetical protein
MYGQMAESMKDNGVMENNMEKENINYQMELFYMEFGIMGKELNGLKK